MLRSIPRPSRSDGGRTRAEGPFPSDAAVRDDAGVIRKLVVGADASTAGRAAIQWAADLAAGTGAHVTVVHAAGLVERARAASEGDDEDAFEDDLRTQVERDWCAPLRAVGVDHDVVVQPGPPVATLLDVAGADADLLVVGRRGAGSADGPQLGSTSAQLVAEADISVVVVVPHAAALA
jgi:nucleotide-binding universal stress UspA family protein